MTENEIETEKQDKLRDSNRRQRVKVRDIRHKPKQRWRQRGKRLREAKRREIAT